MSMLHLSVRFSSAEKSFMDDAKRAFVQSWLEVGARRAVPLLTYAAEFRYPDEILEPARDEFDQALQSAEGIFFFTLSILPKEVHP